MAQSRLYRAAIHLDIYVRQGCKFARKNAPSLTLAVGVLVAALKHFQEKEVSKLTMADGFTIGWIPFLATLDIYKLTNQIREAIPDTIGWGLREGAEFRRSVGPHYVAASRFFGEKNQSSLVYFGAAISAELVLAALMAVFFSLTSRKMSDSLGLHLLQFFVEVALMALESLVYHFGVKQLKQLRNECRDYNPGAVVHEQQQVNHQSDSESSSSSSGGSRQASVASSVNSLQGPEAPVLSICNDLVRFFSYSHSSSEYGSRHPSPDSQSSAFDNLTLNQATPAKKGSENGGQQGSPSSIIDIEHKF